MCVHVQFRIGWKKEVSSFKINEIFFIVATSKPYVLCLFENALVATHEKVIYTVFKLHPVCLKPIVCDYISLNIIFHNIKQWCFVTEYWMYWNDFHNLCLTQKFSFLFIYKWSFSFYIRGLFFFLLKKEQFSMFFETVGCRLELVSVTCRVRLKMKISV